MSSGQAQYLIGQIMTGHAGDFATHFCNSVLVAYLRSYFSPSLQLSISVIFQGQFLDGKHLLQ